MQRAGGAAAALRALQPQVFAMQAQRGARFGLRHVLMVRDFPGLQEFGHRARFDVSDTPRHPVAQSGNSVLQMPVQPVASGKARGELLQARDGKLCITQPSSGVECLIKKCVQATLASLHGSRGEQGFQRKQPTRTDAPFVDSRPSRVSADDLLSGTFPLGEQLRNFQSEPALSGGRHDSGRGAAASDVLTHSATAAAAYG
jgi:hypothetical protein